VQTAQIMAVQALTWAPNSLTKRLVLELGLVLLGYPVQAGEVQEVASTSLSPPPTQWWILDVFRPRLPNAASIPQYMSDAPVGMLRRGILFHSSCLKGGKTGCCCINTPLRRNTAGEVGNQGGEVADYEQVDYQPMTDNGQTVQNTS
jgi:hypothetical protein